jgi:hypothetical protein
MVVNKRKSAIVPFFSRNVKAFMRRKNMEGFPIQEEYKYLGSIISRNLKIEPHLKYIEKKINFITFKLCPIRMR